MQIVKPSEGYSMLAEAVIKSAMKDLEDTARSGDKYHSCTFFTNEQYKDIYTGLAPHMTRDWERCEEQARKILKEFTKERRK